MTRMKVLISGAGITGNALAFWLSKLSHDVTVVERAPTLRTTGLQIDLRGHGIEVMRRMGLEQAFRSKAAPEQGIQMVDSAGRRWGYFPANKSGKGLQSFTSDFEIMRGDLCRLMYDATKSRAKYVFGTSVESFEEKDGFVEVRFTNGTTDRFDLVVGADGSGSQTRKMMLGSDTADAFYPFDGDYIAYFTVPRPIREGEEYIATSYMAPGRRGVLTRRHNPHDLQVYFVFTTDSERLKNVRRGDVSEEKAAVAEIFRGAGWQTDEFLESLEDATNFYCERMGFVRLESWSRGRVTLVGDAAYCPSANTGMGTTSGMVGAYILAGEIGRHCGVNDTKNGLATALKAYDQTFQPFMNQVQKGLKENKSQYDWMPSGPFGVVMVNCLVWIISLLRLNILGELFLQENVKGWDLPNYDEMLRE